MAWELFGSFMYIKEIRIKNFRSIKDCSIVLDNINVFYGLNDVGKSNILKALNLFFNNTISHNESFSFDKDFCNFSSTPHKKAKEIKISLLLQPPKSYSDNKEFLWEKTWRRDGLHKDSLFNIEDGRNKKYTWAKKLKYRYIPAMKDDLYFSNLLSELYNTLSSSISNSLTSASDNFLSIIKKSTKELSDDLYKQLNFKSEIDLPPDLSSLFSILDFKTDKYSNRISIKNRGDGIKIRHIPSILQFFHIEINKNNTRGTVKTDTIWGYEEPENNLEGGATFELSSQFIKISNEIQILTTTHSPAFYLLKEQTEKCQLLRVSQEENNGTSYTPINNLSENSDSHQDEFLAIISPFIEKERKKLSELENKISELDEKTRDKHIIFVEGKTDKIIIDKYLEKINLSDHIKVLECGSASGVSDYMKSWLFNPNFEGDYQYYILGIVDNDKAGIKAKQDFNEFLTEISSVDRIQKKIDRNNRKDGLIRSLNSKSLGTNLIKHLGNSVPITIEMLFDPEHWKYGIKKGWVVSRNSIDIMHILSNKMDNLDISPKKWLREQGISDDYSIYIYNEVRDESKTAFAKYIISQATDFSALGEILNPFIKKIKRTLGIKDN